MRIRDLLKEWEDTAASPRTAHEYKLRLPIYEAAKVAALAEMYPGRTEEQIITDLLTAALNELQASFPYIKGDDVVAWDEEGDPIYEDAGVTPRFHRKTEENLQRLKQALQEASQQD